MCCQPRPCCPLEPAQLTGTSPRSCHIQQCLHLPNLHPQQRLKLCRLSASCPSQCHLLTPLQLLRHLHQLRRLSQHYSVAAVQQALRALSHLTLQHVAAAALQ